MENSNQQSPIQQPAAPSDSSQSKKLIIILGGVLLLVMVFGAYILGGNKSTNSIEQPSPSPSPKHTLQPKTISPLTEIESKNWKTYINKDFTIKYPPETQLGNSSNDWFGFKNVSLFTLDQSAKNAEDKNFYSIMFAVIKNAPQATPEELAKKDIEINAKGDKTQITANISTYKNNNIDGLYYLDPGEKLDGKRFGINHEITNGKRAVVIEVKNNIAFMFYIRGNNYGLSDEQLQIFDKVLSTFSPNQTILADKPLDELINYTLPSGWRVEKQDKDAAHEASGAIVIKSNDWDDKNAPNFMQTDRPGLAIKIYKNYGGTVYTREDKYKKTYDEIHDPNPGGATDHDLTKLTIAGFPAISYFYTFEGYEHTYNVWQDDNIWSILVTSYQEQNYKKQMDDFLSSITFTKEN